MTYIRKQIEVQCDYCEKKYLKDASEVKRNQKLGRLSFCSFECMGKNNTPYLEKAVRNSLIFCKIYHQKEELKNIIIELINILRLSGFEKGRKRIKWIRIKAKESL